MDWQDDDYAEILQQSKTIAVVGLSNDRFRPSYGIARYLQQEGYRIIPVNPHETEVLGERAYASLLDVPEHVDAVDVFRRLQFVAEVVEQAIRIGAKALWLQPGVGSHAAARRAREGGLKVVLNHCMATELHKLHAVVAE
ncbi:MAG TPA: CoA-binding protein [Chloroflexota bacterium]|jgi:predicted CoA-binding protein|nr:CoA-binding protein [Chloroflexota bacterium]